MGKIAFVFSGQGAQRPGMGKSFYDNDAGVKKLFDDADAIRGGTKEQCFSGDESDLAKTENTQPCLYLTDLAAAVALKSAGVTPDAVAGFSLGEIPALAFAGAFSFDDGFKISCIRGKEMGKAAEENPAKMFAVLKCDDDTVIKVCSTQEGAWPVNFNSPGQVVVSCREEAFEPLKRKFAESGARVVPLKVGGGFHCELMNSASENFSLMIGGFDISVPAMTVYADRTALPYCDDPKTELPKQMISPVIWTKLIQKMGSDGFDTFIEVGIGNTLAGLIRRILPEANVYSVTNFDEMQRVAAEVKNA